MSSLLLAVGMVCGGMTAYVAAMMAVLRRRKLCPACGKRRVTGMQFFRDQALLRCEACGAEFGQKDGGPLIPKALWDAGMRDHPPAARLLMPGESARMRKP